MKTSIKAIVLAISFASTMGMAQATDNASSNQVPVNIDTWQQQRSEGLGQLNTVTPNLMAINAQDVFKIDHQKRDYDLHEIPSVARLMNHPAVGGLVIMNKSGDVLLEHYRDADRSTTFSDQSSTKSIGYVLLTQALKAGKVKMTDKVDKYIPNIGSGFKGRTVGDVAAMAVNHNVAELAAYTGDKEALIMFDRDERVIGLQRNDKRETLRDFIPEIKAAGKTNEWDGEIANYATINTSVLGLILESATGIPLSQQVRDLMHDVGGENTMYVGTDFDGTPVIGASMMSSTVDFARYGRLLIADEKNSMKDMKDAQKAGEVVPADLTAIEGRYYKSAIMTKFGLGHSGWGGQLIWADPVSGTIIAINSRMSSELPAPYDHFVKLYTAAIDVVKDQRAKQAK
jgi:CubicO group peptidase (beta-lactamase class C family)